MVKNKPLVSVIIPSLPHRKNQLDRAIKSVKNQTYKNIEIIVEYGGKNVQDARNIAVERSHGEFIAFMDDDDEWYPEKIAMQVLAMQRYENMSLCITWGEDFKFGLYNQIRPKEWWTFKELIDGFNISCTSAFMCRRSSFDAVGGMDDTLDDAHEYDLAVKLSCVGTVYCVQALLTIFHESEDNWSDDFGKKIRGNFQFTHKWGFAFDRRRWRNTIACFVLFSIGLVWGKPIHKLFNMTKNKKERDDEKNKD